MAEIYRMPSVSPTMEVGTIVEWRLAEGEAFESGAVVADIGTDKANMEAEIFDEGVMLKHLVAEDDEVPTGAPMAIIGSAADEDFAALLSQARAELEAAIASIGSEAEQATPPPAAHQPEPAANQPAPAPPPSAPVEVQGVTRSWMGSELTTNFMEPPGDIRAASVVGRLVASPLARKVAEDLGVDLRRLSGSGPGGRIVRDDVEAASKAAPTPAAAKAAPEDERIKLTPMRKTIAKRLLASHQDIPTFFLTTDFDTAGFVQLRSTLKAQLPDVRVSYNDMLIAAVARALREYPKANASWTDKGIIQHGRVDIGIAVALPGGLITPVVRNADTLRFSEIGGLARELAGRAREQKLTPEEYTGGTFTISNLGMMDIDHFTAIINPPEAAILAVGRLTQVPVVVDGELTVGWRMKVTMTCDHRVIDGATGAEFLQVLRRYVETPALLLA